jgi:hypothetical protein
VIGFECSSPRVLAWNYVWGSLAFYRAKAEITEVLRFAQHDSIFEDGLCCRPIRTLMVNKLLKINWLSAGTRGDRPESMVEGGRVRGTAWGGGDFSVRGGAENPIIVRMLV